MVIVTKAQSFTTFFTFHGGDGATPQNVKLAQGVDGAFYGTTVNGGETGGAYCGHVGCGTLFRITSGAELASLRVTPNSGFRPSVGLVLATNGKFYGTTDVGGRTVLT